MAIRLEVETGVNCTWLLGLNLKALLPITKLVSWLLVVTKLLALMRVFWLASLPLTQTLPCKLWLKLPAKLQSGKIKPVLKN